MAWTSFKLGRPGFEYAFDAPPDSFDVTWARMGADNRNLSGDLKERVIRTFAPTVKLKSGWWTKADVDNLASLLTITDTFLSFLCRDDWKIILEPDLPLTTSTVQIQRSSITRLSAAYVAAGLSSTITVTGVYVQPDGSGTNYYTGGSYADATRTITLGTALPDTRQTYVSYTYSGWLVRAKSGQTPITGGRVDLFTLGDMTLEPA